MLRQQTNSLVRVTALAVASRISVLLLGKAASLCFSRFDPSSALSPVKSPFKYLESWDTVHFINISNHGYTHEHSLPFFPLVPLIARVLNITDILTTGVVVSNLTFVASAAVLYKLSLVFFHPQFSMIASVFFIFNPASIIYSAYYTESVFTLVFLLGLLYTVKRQHFRASLLFAISSFSRSNAMFFVIFQKLIYAPITLLPMCCFQLYSLLLLSRLNTSFRIFVPYSFIQRKYWDQGFLRFLKVQNAPNILIGLPVILLSSFFVYQHFKLARQARSRRSNDEEPVGEDTKCENTNNSGTAAKCGTSRLEPVGSTAPPDVYFYDMRVNLLDIADPQPPRSILEYELMSYKGSEINKLALLLLLQVLLLVFCIHWNIAMRFIAYNPFLYWSAAYYTLRHSKTTAFTHTCTFFAVYGLLYIIMFSSFYPPP